jgi:hypothetical protein
LAPPAIYNSGGGYPWSVAIGDLNGDGHADLAVTNAGPESTNVGVLLGHGDGTFATAAIYDCGGLGPQSVAIAHLNGDERADLVVVNAWSNSVAVLSGHGDGTFASPVTYSSGGGFTWSVAIGDLNGDGRPDLAVANSENSVAVLFNTEVSPPPTVVDVTPSLTELQAVPASPSTALLTDAVLSSGTLNLSVGTFAISTDNEQSAINPIDRALAWTGTWLDI